MDFGTPTKLRYAQQLAAALAFIGLIRADRVKIETLGQPLRQPSPVLRGRPSVWRMMSQLEAIMPQGHTSLADGIKHFSLRNPGRGVLVLITD